MRFELGRFRETHREALEKLDRDRAVERIWAEDATFWKTDPAHRKSIESALGWLTIADRMAGSATELTEFARRLSSEADRVVVLGMGGSSLAPLVFASSFLPRFGEPVVEVLDSTEPSSVLATAERSDPSRTFFIVSSKSGTTLEPNIFFDYFFDHASKSLGNAAGQRFLVITDPGSALEKEARRRNVRRVFPGDPRIGGRYSALSNFGLVPAAFAGVPLGELLSRARAAAAECRRPASENPGVLLGAAMGALALGGRDKLTFSVGRPVDRFGMWLEQLIAESTGKEGKGILPVDGETLGGPEAYGSDRFFASIGPAGAGFARALRPLTEAGHPAAVCDVSDAIALGAEMFRWEFATAVAGALLGINPFDQPNVQEAKDRTNEILESGGGRREAGGEPGIDREALRTLLGSLKNGDYFAITAYLPSTRENEDALNATRLRVRDARRVATTLGFGPRFLHSTGQLHKGGPDTGVFLQVTVRPREDVPIPGRPYGFSKVVAAQAAGDLAALKSRGRRALSVHLEDVEPGLRQLDRAVEECLSLSPKSEVLSPKSGL